MKTLGNKIKQSLVVIVFGILLSIVPFYFETKAMTEDNYKLNIIQDQDIAKLEEQAAETNINQALEKMEIKHNKEILLRIEKKVDELKKEVKALD